MLTIKDGLDPWGTTEVWVKNLNLKVKQKYDLIVHKDEKSFSLF